MRTYAYSHYIGSDSTNLSGYQFSSRMLITEARGSIGVTFHSLYPNSDSSYQLLHSRNRPFIIMAEGTKIKGETKSGVVPATNTWYWFIVEIENVGSQTIMRVKIWAEGAPEPTDWLAEANDRLSTRLIAGTFGISSALSGYKYWDDLQVEHLVP